MLERVHSAISGWAAASSTETASACSGVVVVMELDMHSSAAVLVKIQDAVS